MGLLHCEDPPLYCVAVALWYCGDCWVQVLPGAVVLWRCAANDLRGNLGARHQ